MQSIEELMALAPTFQGLAPEHLRLIAGCGRNERFGTGERMFREGEPAERFFLVREGAVALEVQAPGRGALVIETLHPREIVGWSWLFEPHRWQFDARAIEPTRVITLRRRLPARQVRGRPRARLRSSCAASRARSPSGCRPPACSSWTCTGMHALV